MVEEKFSINRFESIMNIANISWQQINKELAFDAERMLKHPFKPPMKNVIRKACDITGVECIDYVMMKTDTFIFQQDNSYASVGTSNRRYGVGRPPSLSKEDVVVAIELLKYDTYESIAKRFNVGTSTLYRAVSKYKNKKEENTMNIPNEIQEAVAKNGGNAMHKTTTNNVINYNDKKDNNLSYRETNRNFMSDIFYKIDRISDEELDKVQEYLDATKKLRSLKNSLLG